MPTVNDPISSDPETEGSQEEASADKGPPGSPGAKRVDFDVELEDVRRLPAIDEGSEEGDESAPLLEECKSRRESILSHALKGSCSDHHAPEPRRYSINQRRRGSFGQGVFIKPEPLRRKSIVVQEVRRTSLPPLEEEEGKPPGPRRQSIVVQEVRRRSTAPKLDAIGEEEKDREEGSEEDVEKGGEEEEPAEEEGRAAWGSQLEFLLTCIGYAVGLGNVWRFPYLCYKNGGGAFLIPYILMLALVGLPLFFMELAMGQFASLGPITIWKLNPLLKGLGYSMVIVSWLIGLYYNVIISHTLFFLFASMTSVLPWTTCDNDWNTEACLMPPDKNGNSTLNGTGLLNGTTAMAPTVNLTGTKTPSEEYYMNYVLEQSSGMDEFGVPSWKLLLCLLLAWSIVLVCLLRGIQSLGKVVYFTAIFPYVMLTILLIRGVTLPGAIDGILFYIKPDFAKLGDSRVWSDAATQIFYSLGACSGGLIAMSSYNKFDNNCLRDSLIVAHINCGTSVFAGFVIFSVLGFMANAKGVDVKDVAAGGPGLAFVVYPEAIASMPVAPLWSILFFIMMATLGFGTQFSIMECVLSALTDELKRFIHGPKEAIILRSTVIGVSFLVGIPMICKGGIYLLNLVDYSVSGFPLLFVGVFELIALGWIYGFQQFSEDIKMMLGHKPNIYWKACWMFVSPLIIIVTILFNVAVYKAPEYDGYVYPAWAQFIGWLIALWPILMIPGWFLYQYFTDGGWALLKEAAKPEIEWGPALSENRTAAYSEMFDDGEDNDEVFDVDGSKSTIYSTREHVSTIVVCKNRRKKAKNGILKGHSAEESHEAEEEGKGSESIV